MLDQLKSIFLPLRIRVPFLIDIVVLTKAEQIRAVESSGDLDRLHTFETAKLPWWTRKFFRATRFHDAASDLWFLAFEPTSDPDYDQRRAYLEKQVAEGYSPDDVTRIADLLKDSDDGPLTDAMVQIIMRRFIRDEQPVPPAIIAAAKQPLQGIGEALIPGRYAKAQQANRESMQYSQQQLAEGAHPIDAGHHNFGEIVQTTTGALRILANNLTTPVEQLFTEHPLTPQVPRIAVRSSKLGGLLWFATTPGWTMVILKIGKAARETGDIRFTFGTGHDERQCVFRDFFLNFMRDLQAELRSRHPTP